MNRTRQNKMKKGAYYDWLYNRIVHITPMLIFNPNNFFLWANLRHWLECIVNEFLKNAILTHK